MRREFEEYALFPAEAVCRICLCDDRENMAAEAEGRLKHVRDKLLIIFRIEIRQVNVAMLGVILQVKVGAICQAADLVELVRVVKVEVLRAFGVMRAVAFGYFYLLNVFRRESEQFEPLVHLALPVLELFLPLQPP